jgi:hypothetical protein
MLIGLTGIGLPAAAVVGGIAITAAAAATIIRATRGDDGVDVLLSAVGVIPGGVAGGARVAMGAARSSAQAAGTLTGRQAGPITKLVAAHGPSIRGGRYRSCTRIMVLNS